MSKPTPVVHAVELRFYVGKCPYNYSFKTKECVRVGIGPMTKNYPLDETSVNDRMAKEFATTIHGELS